MLDKREHFDIFIIDLIFRFSPIPEKLLEERFKKILSEAQVELEQTDFLQKSIFWGRKLIEDIQSIPQYASIPIVALSAVANAISEKVQKDLHIFDIIPKRGLRIAEMKRRVLSAIRWKQDDFD